MPGHDHHTSDYNRSFALGVLLNVAFVIVEVVYGIASGSLALIADAGHNLSDVLGLLLAWGAAVLAGRATSERRTYGLRKLTVFASLTSALLLMLALGGIAWEAIERIGAPSPVAGATVIVVAAIGVVVNTATALLFVRGQKHDLNLRGAFLHMVADAAVSFGVVIAGTAILLFGWSWIDPVVSLLIVTVVLIGTLGLLRDSFNYALDAVPKQIDVGAIREYLLGIDVVSGLHDLHIWPLSTTENALTVHLVVRSEQLDNALISTIQQELGARHGIHHATLQLESANGGSHCLLGDCCGD